jgi:hypothetical protein
MCIRQSNLGELGHNVLNGNTMLYICHSVLTQYATMFRTNVCLTPDNFTHQGDILVHGWINMAQKSRKYLTSSGRCQKRPSVKMLNFALFFSNESLPLPTLVEYYKPCF